MTTPTVTETTARLERVSPDPFIDAIERPNPTQASASPPHTNRV
jgi:hypothetical protein